MQHDSQSWIWFTAINFAISVGMTLIGILVIEVDMATKGFFAMAALMLVSSSISLSKTMRDRHESGRLVNRLDEARTEKLLSTLDDAA